MSSTAVIEINKQTMTSTTVIELEGKLIKCKSGWISFDNNLKRLLEERTLVFKGLKESVENFAYDEGLNMNIQNLAELDDITSQIFNMIEQRIDHTKVFMPVMEELVKTMKQSQEKLEEAQTKLKRIEILSKYRDWIKRFRSVILRKMKEIREFKSWNEVEEVLREEEDEKELHESVGADYEQKYTKHLESVLKGYGLTRSEFDLLLNLKHESNIEFHSSKSNLSDLKDVKDELAQTTFPESIADVKEPLEKALNAVEIWVETSKKHIKS